MILDDKMQALLQRVTRSLEESEVRVEQSRSLIQRCENLAEKCRRGEEWTFGELGSAAAPAQDPLTAERKEEDTSELEPSQGTP